MSPTLAAIERVLDEGRREGVAPALSAAVRRGGAVVHASWHGDIPAPSHSTGSGQAPRKLGKDDLFDVASLTKVMATATLAAQLAGEGALALDAPVAARLPAFGAAGKEVWTWQPLRDQTGVGEDMSFVLFQQAQVLGPPPSLP